MRGGRDPLTGFVSNEADALFIEGDIVTFYVSAEESASTDVS
jgi:hypothetical protein